MNTKICSKCKEAKPLTEFYKNKTKKDGRTYRCKSCSNRDHVKSGRGRKYQTSIKGKCAAALSGAKIRAKEKDLSLDIDTSFLQDLHTKQQGKCAITGQPLLLGESAGYAGSGAALDRVDNAKGYTKDNVQWLCSWVNNWKSTLTEDQFKDRVRILYEAFNENPSLQHKNSEEPQESNHGNQTKTNQNPTKTQG